MGIEHQTPAAKGRRFSRRGWISGVGLGLAGIGAGLAYRVSPTFWRQYFNELGRDVAPPSAIPKVRQWTDRGLYAAWLGHSTVLLRLDGFTILTDPVFSTRIGLRLGPVTLGLKRLVEPALRLPGLPKIDLVLLSHAHMDHFDLPSLKALESLRPPVVTARNTSDLLDVGGYARVSEIGWDERVNVGPATIEGIRVNHWGARMRTDTWRGYNGYVIRCGRWKVLFAGDTAWTDDFKGIGGAHLAVMPVGAYNPWIRYHCSPEQAWTMANHAKADYVVPVHHRTFSLSREPIGEPAERLLKAAGGTSRVGWQDIGQQFELS
ncbi:MAG TPA: MBL fold metallo-hydrolase [Bryobacteraceae bacterium]|nr:MBL fold metallo-hydrolase [Bryobacteraceae bacterium]HPT26138.1 MBL fold metallo-hydrolase [Bryobacteraceae bacterium]